MAYFSHRDRALLEALQFDPTAKPGLELLKSCLIWPDERPDGLTSEVTKSSAIFGSPGGISTWALRSTGPISRWHGRRPCQPRANQRALVNQLEM